MDIYGGALVQKALLQALRLQPQPTSVGPQSEPWAIGCTESAHWKD